MRRRLVDITVLGLALLLPGTLAAKKTMQSSVALADSSRFVTASLLVVTPGPDLYSVFGHTALRMQCPSQHLDYCFSFETKTDLGGYLSFFAGRLRAGFLPVPTAMFLDGYRRQGRGVRQYDLNLTLHEKQELWRALDDDMLEGAHRKFNLLQNNCTSMAMLKIESILDHGFVEVRRWPEPMTWNNGRGIRWLSRRAPWGQFLYMTFVGSEADTYWAQEHRLSPELIVPVLQQTVVREGPDVSPQALRAAGAGAASSAPLGVQASPRAAPGVTPAAVGPPAAVRPLLTGRTVTLVPRRTVYAASPLTPNLFFGALLVVCLALALLPVRRPRHRHHHPGSSSSAADAVTVPSFLQGTDGRAVTPAPPVAATATSSHTAARRSHRPLTLCWGRGTCLTAVVLSVHFLLGLFLLYVTLVSGLFGVHWNWLLIPFCPLPLLLWLAWRRRTWYPRVYAAYVVVLGLFLVVVPALTSQLLPAHYLLVASLALMSLTACRHAALYNKVSARQADGHHARSHPPHHHHPAPAGSR